MSQVYDEYIHEHVSNVVKAFNWLIDHQIIPTKPTTWLDFQVYQEIANHDDSKWEGCEYDAYDDYFYGKEGRDEEDIKVINDSFNYAWLHHIHNNPHHWQYWVLLEDEGKTKALEMPESCVYEMISDWWSFSWKTGNLSEIFKWYDEHKDRMVLHEKTRKLVEEILGRLKDVLKEPEEVSQGTDEEAEDETPS